MIHLSIWVFYVLCIVFFVSGFFVCSLVSSNSIKEMERRHYCLECSLKGLASYWENKFNEVKEHDDEE